MDPYFQRSPRPDRADGGRHHLGLSPHQWRPFRALPGPSLRRHAFQDNLEATPRKRWWS